MVWIVLHKLALCSFAGRNIPCMQQDSWATVNLLELFSLSPLVYVCHTCLEVTLIQHFTAAAAAAQDDDDEYYGEEDESDDDD
jgi:hypothetical protein